MELALKTSYEANVKIKFQQGEYLDVTKLHEIEDELVKKFEAEAAKRQVCILLWWMIYADGLY